MAIRGFKRVYAVVREEDNIVAPVAELMLKDEFVYSSVHFMPGYQAHMHCQAPPF